ncbi:hypothetical protein SAMN04488503_2493 [Humidesulfovibrio mexicanus]|uniref:Bacteriophage Rz lysis protein n=1 Tax=Humidesulfovibrio mexicanus TaxID=147047 RepID=A0A239BDQ2_9BACT|nr:hypothetical protein [Humidesulfovibrio mexicanus]SNS05859.1 hypothetical protein SAMN04488503_2493 [Humidesulfovibrio mexicanus]
MIPLDLTKPAVKLALGLGGALAVLLLCLACAWGGYRYGHATAKAGGDKALAELRQTQADANRLASDTARRIVDAEIIRRDQLAEDLATARATIAAQGRAITNQRIAHASQSVAVADGRCTFGHEWVGLYNEAWGFGHGDPAGAASAPGPDGEAGSLPAAQAGEFQQGGVTPEDVLAVNRDNARICRDTTAKYLALREWALGLPRTTDDQEARP